ncbi:hypothetical protein OF377_02445 [Ureaplasma sp. ES3154-GEN]|uniref:hypothetical protein n=1 Tax=Ureaplasma sp. ES3154-GEN TaxID=2984844 RepID=UPI0021E83165|nr:hypothetical protein [Ureaplasma sp. ES3154-GEN]MCV3743723.1 hypothetical protein [Ureaplasma sp. ES3154-GEN]
MKRKSNRKLLALTLASVSIGAVVIGVASACGVDRTNLVLQTNETTVKNNKLYVQVSVPYVDENTLTQVRNTTFNVVVNSVPTDNQKFKNYGNLQSKALPESIKKDDSKQSVSFLIEFPKINDKYNTITNEVEIVISPQDTFKLITLKTNKDLYKILDLEASTNKMSINKLDTSLNFNVQNANNIGIETIIMDVKTKQKYTSEKTKLDNETTYDAVFKNFLIEGLNNDLDEKLELTDLLFSNLALASAKNVEQKINNSTLIDDVKSRAILLVNYINKKAYGTNESKILKEFAENLVETYDIKNNLALDKLLISLLAEFIGYYNAETKIPYGYLTTKYIDLAKAININYFSGDETKTNELTTFKNNLMTVANELLPTNLLTSINQQNGNDFKDRVINYVNSLNEGQQNELLVSLFKNLLGYQWTYQYDFYVIQKTKIYDKQLVSLKMTLVNNALEEIKNLLTKEITLTDLETLLTNNELALSFTQLTNLKDKLIDLKTQLTTFTDVNNPNVQLAQQNLKQTYNALLETIQTDIQLADLKTMGIDLINFFTRNLSSKYERSSDEQTSLEQIEKLKALQTDTNPSVQVLKDFIKQNKAQEKMNELNSLITELNNKKTSANDLYLVKRVYNFVMMQIYNDQDQLDPTLKQFFKSANEKNQFTFEYNLKNR